MNLWDVLLSEDNLFVSITNAIKRKSEIKSQCLECDEFHSDVIQARSVLEKIPSSKEAVFSLLCWCYHSDEDVSCYQAFNLNVSSLEMIPPQSLMYTVRRLLDRKIWTETELDEYLSKYINDFNDILDVVRCILIPLANLKLINILYVQTLLNKAKCSGDQCEKEFFFALAILGTGGVLKGCFKKGTPLYDQRFLLLTIAAKSAPQMLQSMLDTFLANNVTPDNLLAEMVRFKYRKDWISDEKDEAIRLGVGKYTFEYATKNNICVESILQKYPQYTDMIEYLRST